MRDVSRVASHHSSSRPRRPVDDDLLDRLDLEAAALDDRAELLRIAEPERSRCVVVGWVGEPKVERGPAGRGDPGIDAESSPRRRARPAHPGAGPARSRRHALPCRGRASSRSGRARRRRMRRAASSRRRPRRRTRRLRARARRRAAGRPRPSRERRRSRAASPPGWISGSSLEADLARPGSELEDPLPRSWLEQLDHPLGERRRGTRKQLPLALPAGGDAPPGLDLFRRAVAVCRHALEGRDDVLAVGRERLLLAVRHQVDRVLVDTDRLELAQLRRRLLDRPEHREAVADLVGHEGAVGRADARVVVVVVELPGLDVVGERLRERRSRRCRSGRSGP